MVKAKSKKNRRSRRTRRIKGTARRAAGGGFILMLGLAAMLGGGGTAAPAPPGTPPPPPTQPGRPSKYDPPPRQGVTNDYHVFDIGDVFHNPAATGDSAERIHSRILRLDPATPPYIFYVVECVYDPRNYTPPGIQYKIGQYSADVAFALVSGATASFAESAWKMI